MNPDESKQDVFETPVDQKKEARRIRLLENLKKGRETALANRKKKGLHTLNFPRSVPRKRLATPKHQKR